jgi:hypothetical protein
LLLQEFIITVKKPINSDNSFLGLIYWKTQESLLELFGKFNVLIGAEKIVRINVNGVEANFHVYLDNYWEDYFVK